jgi:hypothetical protein
VIGTDIQNTTLPNKGPAKSKGIVLGKLKK